MNYLVTPERLIFNAHGYVNGFSDMVKNENIPHVELLKIAVDVAKEWTESWDDDQGFGGSDTTYMVQDFIDNVIYNHTSALHGFNTKFNPRLSVVQSCYTR